MLHRLVFSLANDYRLNIDMHPLMFVILNTKVMVSPTEYALFLLLLFASKNETVRVKV